MEINRYICLTTFYNSSMKKNVVLLLFLLAMIIQENQAQSYHPLIKTNKFWDVVNNFDDGFPCMCHCSGLRDFYAGYDTIIENVKYARFKASPLRSIYGSIGPFCPPYYADTLSGLSGILLHEDSVAQKVFIYDYFSHQDDLLYDFSLEVGDTLLSDYTTGGYPAIVQSIENIMLNNGDIIIKFNFTDYDAFYIESIGGSQGLSGGLLMPEYPDELFCVEDQGVGLLSDCAGWVDISEIQFTNSIQIFPNPAVDFIRITGLKTNSIASIKIYNGLGTEIISRDLSINTETIDVSQLQNGCYLLRVGNNGNYASTKFIIRR